MMDVGKHEEMGLTGRDKFEAQKAEECECDFFRDTDTHTDILWHVFLIESALSYTCHK